MKQKERETKEKEVGGGDLGVDPRASQAAKLRAAANALKAAQALKEKEDEERLVLQEKQQKKMRAVRICVCGHPQCDIGPFTVIMTMDE